MQKQLRLTSSGRFSQIHQGSRSWVNSLLVLKALPNESHETRFGIITTRRIGNAVVRNQVKRRLREVLRNVPVKPGWDIVVIARNRKGVHRFVQLRMAAQSLLLNADLIMSTSTVKATITWKPWFCCSLEYINALLRRICSRRVDLNPLVLSILTMPSAVMGLRKDWDLLSSD